MSKPIIMKVNPRDKEILGIKTATQIQKDLDEQCVNAKHFYCSVCEKLVPFYHCVHASGKVKSWGEK